MDLIDSIVVILPTDLYIYRREGYHWGLVGRGATVPVPRLPIVHHKSSLQALKLSPYGFHMALV